mmetsp:Transcript_17081/g.20573  ORF Transcript_17081/g.20573 Transcript_17081/m.20573 type:complete len:397 (+) Transcript_17081:628-1818(+)
MDGICVQDNIVNFELDSTHVLIAQGTFLSGPLHGSNAGVLDFVQVLHSLTHVNEHVRTSGLGTEAPDLLGQILVPFELLSKETTTSLGVIPRSNKTLINGFRQSFLHGNGLQVDTVMLVGRLGHNSSGRGLAHSLTEGNNWLGNTDRSSTHEVLLQVLQADLQVKLTSTSNNMLTGLLDRADNHRVGLGQTLQTLDQLGKVGGNLGLNRDTHDRGDGELHSLDGVGIDVLLASKGGVLDDVGIETDHSHGVTARNGFHGVLATTHAKHGTLDVLDVQVLLLAWDVVRSHDTDLETGRNLTGEHTTEGVETTLILGGDHLGNVQHKRTILIAVLDGGGVLVIFGTLVQVIETVALGHPRRRQVVHHHLQQSHVGWEPVLHDTLHQGLAAKLLLVALE